MCDSLRTGAECFSVALCPSSIRHKPPSKEVSADPLGHTELQIAFPYVRTSPQGVHTAAFAQGPMTYPAGERCMGYSLSWLALTSMAEWQDKHVDIIS
ncbi:rCG52744 [Rattus norvegicus]|uniref:RCG52744 n=1 Tax=Rattus norvegicus TaxID=10116 RepID=A6IQF7_RAT|nr:rCG52744 [Rattus norvegicus]